ncbi:MAG: hypothetical protein J5489_05505, partial [Lachnospiraceae bacterium]|nr:hypothetical protein [Lachnospiraceae bacterium]
LRENRVVLDKIAEHLFEKETITGKEFMKIFRQIKGIPEPEEAVEEVAPEKMEGTVDGNEDKPVIEEKKFPAIEEKPFVIPEDEKAGDNAAVFAKGGVIYTTTAKAPKPEEPSKPKTGIELAKEAAEKGDSAPVRPAPKVPLVPNVKAPAKTTAKPAAKTTAKTSSKTGAKKSPGRKKKKKDETFPFKK